MQPDRADGRTGPGRPVRALPRSRPRPARGPQRLPRPRPLRRRQRQPGAVLRAHRRPGPAAAHEGDRPARPAPARGPGPGRPAAFQPQGAGRERHDRRSPAERRGPRRRDRQRRRARAVHGRTLRDGAPAHLGRHRTAAAGNRAGRAVPGALPLRFRHRSAQGELHGRHPLAGADSPWRLLRRDRSRRTARRAGPGPLQRRHPDRRRRHGRPAMPSTAPAAASPGTRSRRRSMRRSSPRRRSSPQPVREFELLETMRYEPRQGLRNRDRHLRRMAESAEHLGFRFDLSDGAGGPAVAAHGCGRGPGPVAAAAHRSDGRRRGGAARHPAGARPPRSRRRTGRPARAVAPPQDDLPGALRPSPSATARRRRRHHGQHARGAHRGHPGHPRAEGRRDLVHTPAGVRVPPGRRARPPARPRRPSRAGAPARGPGHGPRRWR